MREDILEFKKVLDLRPNYWTMKSADIFHLLGDLLQWTFGIFEMIGNIFNYGVILLGFIGMFYWLNLQRKFNAQAKSNPNQIK